LSVNLKVLSGSAHFNQWIIAVMSSVERRSASVESRPQNNLIRALRSEDYALIAGQLAPRDSGHNHRLYSPGQNVDTVYFPCGPSLVSFRISNGSGRDVETVLVGREGAVGGIVSEGHLPAYTEIVVQFGGPFVLLKTSDLSAAKEKSASFRALFARYADCLLAQIFQSNSCNAIHSLEQRTAKWILSAMERTGDDHVPLTQDRLAALLGVGRTYASKVINNFKREKILEPRRGMLRVVDSRALEAKSCDCNGLVKAHFETVLKGVYPTEED
jgi:hypothetical protein